MEVICLADAGAFLEAARPAFEREPVLSNVVATNAAAVRDGRSRPVGPRWYVLREGAHIVGVAMQTAPYPLWLGPMSDPMRGPVSGPDGARDTATADDATADDAARALVAHYADHGWTTPGVNGVRAEATAFARRWEAHAGVTATVVMDQLQYELVDLVPAIGADGAPIEGTSRLAVEGDLPLLVAWMHGFSRDVGESHVLEDAELLMRERIEDGNALLWLVDGQPVSMAGIRRASVGVARVGPVYTPAQHRRNGYAAAVTAAVSRLAFERGAQRCMLFTDAANPTSNAVYLRLGYRVVGDAVRYVFTDA
jgi:predicted GNAT family acetyltransferase